MYIINEVYIKEMFFLKGEVFYYFFFFNSIH